MDAKIRKVVILPYEMPISNWQTYRWLIIWALHLTVENQIFCTDENGV